MADAYGTLAADYDWLFGDDVLADGGAINQPRGGTPAAADRPHQRGAGRGLWHGHRCGGAGAPGFHRMGGRWKRRDGRGAAARFQRERLAIPLLHVGGRIFQRPLANGLMWCCVPGMRWCTPLAATRWLRR